MTRKEFETLDFVGALCAFHCAIEATSYFARSKLRPCKKGFYSYFRDSPDVPAITHIFYTKKGLERYIADTITWETMEEYLTTITRKDVQEFYERNFSK